MLLLSGFPLAGSLRSADSAPPSGGLFAFFIATTLPSDSSAPSIPGCGMPCLPGALQRATPLQGTEASQVPVRGSRACLRSWTLRSRGAPRHRGTARAAFGDSERLGTPEDKLFDAR